MAKKDRGLPPPDVYDYDDDWDDVEEVEEEEYEEDDDY